MFFVLSHSQEQSALDIMLALDHYLTSVVGVSARPQRPWQQAVKACCMCLELSGHGLVWFAVCGVLMVLFALTREEVYYSHGLNMFLVLVMDIIVVAPLKLVFRRPRPALNIGKIPMSVSSVDNLAFPSGHASRCVALAAYFCYMPPFTLRTHLWYIWAVVVSLSRVLIGRHHISDVLAGMLAGLFIIDSVWRLGLLWGV